MCAFELIYILVYSYMSIADICVCQFWRKTLFKLSICIGIMPEVQKNVATSAHPAMTAINRTTAVTWVGDGFVAFMQFE